MKVLLINRERAYGMGTTVQGHSGKVYGTSRYDPAYACQVCELTLEQYEAAREDLRKCVSLISRNWHPKFIVEEPVKEFAQGYALAMDGKGLPESSSRAMTLGWGYAQPSQAVPTFTVDLGKVSEEELALVAALIDSATDGVEHGHHGPLPTVPIPPFFTLKKMAKDAGVWKEGMKSREILEALNLKQEA